MSTMCSAVSPLSTQTAISRALSGVRRAQDVEPDAVAVIDLGAEGARRPPAPSSGSLSMAVISSRCCQKTLLRDDLAEAGRSR